jgi:hypothetical protein
MEPKQGAFSCFAPIILASASHDLFDKNRHPVCKKIFGQLGNLGRKQTALCLLLSESMRYSFAIPSQRPESRENSLLMA